MTLKQENKLLKEQLQKVRNDNVNLKESLKQEQRKNFELRGKDLNPSDTRRKKAKRWDQ